MLNSLLVVDGNSIASRAFFTGKRFFFSLTDKIITSVNGRWPPFDGMAVVFDDRYASSWRNELYPPYKANRSDNPEKQEFMDKLYLSAVALGLCAIRFPEADDMIASLSVSSVAKEMVIYSGDKDMFALVKENVHLVGFEKINGVWEKVIYDLADIHDKFGSTPQQVMDYKAMAGDSSDNIPGVKGIGDKTAKKLLGAYGNLAAIYDNLHELPKNIRQKLEDDEANARLSQKLASLDFSCPVALDETKANWTVTPASRARWATEALR